jgi:RHS repeat-associated protein
MLEQPSSGATVAYVYDRAGRIVKKTTGEKREYFKYDSRDLMTKYWVETDGNTSVSEYVYDVNNQRVAKTDTSDAPTSIDGKKRFVWDGDNILYDGPVFYLNNIMVNGYEAEIQELRIVTYLKDALGSVRGEVYDTPVNPPASNPDIKPFSYKTFEYSAFGESLDSPSTSLGDRAREPGAELKNEGIGFTGHYKDKESNLYYARARYYNPETGRFITSDPIRYAEKRYSPAGLNRYIYGLNNPTKYWDPDG